MASEAFAAVGSKFYRKDPTTSVYAEMAEITNISGPNMSRDTIDVTNFSSTGGYKEFIASFRDGGEVKLDMNFTKDTYSLNLSDFNQADKRSYRVTLPDASGTKIEFDALLTALDFTAAVNDAVKASVTLKVSGVVTVGIV